MNCDRLCVACDRSKCYYLNYANYHGVCECDHGLQSFTKCVHCRSAVPVLKYSLIAEDDEDMKAIEPKVCWPVVRGFDIGVRKFGVGVPEQMPLESHKEWNLARLAEKLSIPNVHVEVNAGLNRLEQNFTRKQESKMVNEPDEYTKLKSDHFDSSSIPLINQPSQREPYSTKHLCWIIVCVLLIIILGVIGLSFGLS